MPTYPIPQSSAQAWNQFNHGKTPRNPGLIFDRFSPDWSHDSKLKKTGLEQVQAAAENCDAGLLKAWNARWEAGVRSNHAQPFTLETDWRFVSGLGRKGVLEIGFSFQRYGFPSLPGSSVKGIARAWAGAELADHLHSEQLNRIDEVLSLDSEEEFKQQFLQLSPTDEARGVADLFRKVFGTTSNAGRAIFFEAIPLRSPRLDLDVINPHYPKYYQGDEPPADWQSPIPIYFLTVAPGEPFRFAIGWRGQLETEPHNKANEWLVAGLSTLGAGGKTSAGYGYFRESSQAKVESPGAAPAQEALPPGSMRGVVKVFGLGENKSFGFIQPQDGKSDVFFHQNDLPPELKTLEADQRVIFEVEINRRGQRQAKNIRLEE